MADSFQSDSFVPDSFVPDAPASTPPKSTGMRGGGNPRGTSPALAAKRKEAVTTNIIQPGEKIRSALSWITDPFGGVNQMGQGASQIISSGSSPDPWDARVGGALNMGTGLFNAATGPRALLGIGTNLIASGVRAGTTHLAPKLATRLPQAIQQAPTLSELGHAVLPPMAKALVGSQVGNIAGEFAANQMGAGPDVTEGLSNLGATTGGALGGLRLAPKTPGATMLDRVQLNKGLPPKPKDPRELAIWVLKDAFLRSKNPVKTRESLNVLGEIKAEDPLLHNPDFAKVEKSKLPAGGVYERAIEATQKYQAKLMDRFNKVSSFWKQTNPPVMTGKQYADMIEADLPRDINGNLDNQSSYVQKQLDLYRQMPEVRFNDLNKEWHQANGYLNPHYRRSEITQGLDVRRDASDVVFEKARRRIASDAVYKMISPSDPTATEARELMRRWGMAEGVEELLSNQQGSAYVVDPRGFFKRILNVGIGTAEVTSGYGGKAFGIRKIAQGVLPHPSMDDDLLEMFLKTPKTLPHLGVSPMRIGPARQLPAPIISLDRSGVTVPDVRGNLQRGLPILSSPTRDNTPYGGLGRTDLPQRLLPQPAPGGTQRGSVMAPDLGPTSTVDEFGRLTTPIVTGQGPGSTNAGFVPSRINTLPDQMPPPDTSGQFYQLPTTPPQAPSSAMSEALQQYYNKTLIQPPRGTMDVFRQWYQQNLGQK